MFHKATIQFAVQLVIPAGAFGISEGILSRNATWPEAIAVVQ